MKRYDARQLKKPFSHPVWGRAILIFVTLVFPVLYPAFLLWEHRGDFLREWAEVAHAALFPWKNRGD